MSKHSLTLPSTLDSIKKAVNFAEKIANNMKLTETEVCKFAIAISEAVTNAIKHGNKEDKNKNVFININVENEKISVSVKDSGKRFNPDGLKDPTKPENITKSGGRGIYILKSLMDKVDYKFSAEGTELIFHKKYKKNNFEK